MLTLVDVCANKVVDEYAYLRQAIDSIPRDLFPPLFTAAFMKEKTQVLQDLVKRWPFPVLSCKEMIKGLGNAPKRVSMHAVIDAMMDYVADVLSQENTENLERGQQLHLLDLTDDGINPLYAWTPHNPMGVQIDLCVDRKWYPVVREAYQAGAPLRLLCHNLEVDTFCFKGMLEVVDPGVRQNHVVSIFTIRLKLHDLRAILPALVKFKSLNKLILAGSVIDSRARSMKHCVRKFAKLIRLLTSVKELQIYSAYLCGLLERLLGGKKEPLKALEFPHCSLLPEDLYFLSRNMDVSALKKLDFSSINLSELCFPPFLQLLTKASPSILQLRLNDCHFNNSTMKALIPALRLCSRLQFLGIFFNHLSSKTLKTLLHHCVKLEDLQKVAYPCPVDYYNRQPNPYAPLRDDHIRQKLLQFEEEVKRKLVQAGRTDMEWVIDLDVIYFNQL